MRLLCLVPFLVCLMAASSVAAQSADCEEVESSALLIMQARQSGLSRSSILASIGRTGASGEWHQLMSAIVDAAFLETLSSSPGGRLLQARDFSELIGQTCRRNASSASPIPQSTQAPLPAPAQPNTLPEGVISSVPFSSSEGLGFFVIQQFTGAPFTRRIYCSRPGATPAVVSDFPDYGLFGELVEVTPGSDATISADEDDYEVWYQFCQPSMLGEKPSDEMQEVIDLYHQAHNQCRGGSGDSPVTQASCDAATVYETSLKNAGFCYMANDWRVCSQ